MSKGLFAFAFLCKKLVSLVTKCVLSGPQVHFEAHICMKLTNFFFFSFWRKTFSQVSFSFLSFSTTVYNVFTSISISFMSLLQIQSTLWARKLGFFERRKTQIHFFPPQWTKNFCSIFALGKSIWRWVFAQNRTCAHIFCSLTKSKFWESFLLAFSYICAACNLSNMQCLRAFKRIYEKFLENNFVKSNETTLWEIEPR